jgi:hypothetical protein
MQPRVFHRGSRSACIVALGVCLYLPSAAPHAFDRPRPGADAVARVELFGNSNPCRVASLTEMLGEWLQTSGSLESSSPLVLRIVETAVDIAADLVAWLNPSATGNGGCDNEGKDEDDS